MTALSKRLIFALAIGASGCVVSFNEDLLGDSSPPADATDLDAACLACDANGPREHGVHDQPTVVPDKMAPDLPPVACTDWSSWSCSQKVNNAVSRCPKTGTQIYSLGCNTSGCSCNNIVTSSSKSCSGSFGKTCADAQKAFAGGCCSGL